MIFRISFHFPRSIEPQQFSLQLLINNNTTHIVLECFRHVSKEQWLSSVSNWHAEAFYISFEWNQNTVDHTVVLACKTLLASLASTA